MKRSSAVGAKASGTSGTSWAAAGRSALLALVVGGALASWLASSPARADGNGGGEGWRERGAAALLQLKEQGLGPEVIRALGELRAVDHYEEVAKAAAAALKPGDRTEDEELRAAAAYALAKLDTHLSSTVTLLLELAAAEGYAEQSEPCVSLRLLMAGAPDAPKGVLEALLYPGLPAAGAAPGAASGAAAKVEPQTWYFCTGIWERRSVKAMLDARPIFYKLPTIAAKVAPAWREELSKELLQRLSSARAEDKPALQRALLALIEEDPHIAELVERLGAGKEGDARLRAAAASLARPAPASSPAETDAAAKARLLRELGAAKDARRRAALALQLVKRGALAEAVPALVELYGKAEGDLAPLSQALAEALAATKLDEASARQLRPALVRYVKARIDRRDDDAFIAPALFAVGPISRAEGLALLERSYDTRGRLGARDVNALRVLAVALSGGEAAVVTAARFLTSFPLARFTSPAPGEAREVIEALRRVLPPATSPSQEPQLLGPAPLDAEALTAVQADARAMLRRILDDTRWTTADEPFLRSLLTLLPPGPELDELRAAVERRLSLLRPPEQPLLPRLWKWAAALFGAHFLIWLGLLLTLYPRSRMVQAAMLFNPLGRAVTGWGYTQLLVLASPRLRQRLFHPLVDASSDTEVASFDAASFSDRIKVAPILPRKNPQAPAEELPPVAWTKLAEGGGLVVLEGASGLGKTHVLKALLERARAEGRTCLFVRASECNGGVLKEIEERLALDHSSGFVHSMIHRGAIELFLDGLNEAQPSGVAEIAQFCERAVNARITLTTQPMSWPCPRRARRFRLLPLLPEELEEFLLSQWPAVGSGGEAEQAQYAAGVREFLAERTSARDLAVLQNRIDLAFVAHLLARRETPNIHSLRKQVVDDAARAYELASPGGAFPLAGLGAAAMRVLEQGHPVLVIEGLDAAVLAHLAERKILLRRGVADWLFRHDTITCYFAAQGVLAPLITAEAIDPQVISEARLTNPRFTGVYLQLAESLPLAAAQALAAALREHGRASGDRTLEISYQDVLDRRDG